MILSSRRVPALDGLRGVAVLAVMLHHLSFYIPAHHWPGMLTRTLLYAGWSGVDLFFVLSGFLITGILLDEKGAPNYFKAFYARRMLRIFPLYYAVLTAIFLFAALRPGQWPNGELPIAHDRVFYFFYLNNWWPLLKDTWHANIVGHFWSLAVEEQFYLLWPACVWLLPVKRVLPVAIMCIAAALFLRCFLYLHFGPIRDIVENLFTRMDSLFVGVCMATLLRLPDMLRRTKAYIWGMALACAVAIAFINLAAHGFTYSQWYPIVALTLFAGAFGGLVLHAFLSTDDASIFQIIFRSKPLTTVGRYSYGMYVYHVPLMALAYLLTKSFVDPEQSAFISALFIVGVMTATFVVAKLSFDLFESRFLRLKPRFNFLAAEEAISLPGAKTV